MRWQRAVMAPSLDAGPTILLGHAGALRRSAESPVPALPTRRLDESRRWHLYSLVAERRRHFTSRSRTTRRATCACAYARCERAGGRLLHADLTSGCRGSPLLPAAWIIRDDQRGRELHGRRRRCSPSPTRARSPRGTCSTAMRRSPSALQAGATSPNGTSSGFQAVPATRRAPATLLTYTGPVANEQVALSFKQTIGQAPTRCAPAPTPRRSRSRCPRPAHSRGAPRDAKADR